MLWRELTALFIPILVTGNELRAVVGLVCVIRVLLCTRPVSFWETSISLFENTVLYFDVFLYICIVICLPFGVALCVAPYLARLMIVFEEKNSERQTSLTVVIGINRNKRRLLRNEQELRTIGLYNFFYYWSVYCSVVFTDRSIICRN